MRRRDFIRTGGALAAGLALGGRAPLAFAAGDDDWNAGQVRHLLSAANDTRFLIKVSFKAKPAQLPMLRVGRDEVPGMMTDTRGLFWSFDAAGLEPTTSYELALTAGSERLCDPWTLGTFPPRDSKPDRFRLLVFTCAGGNGDLRHPQDGSVVYLSLADRQRMLRRALSFQPQAVVANGDHVYWDLLAGPSARILMSTELATRIDGKAFKRDLPVLGTENEARLDRVVSPQIADLYGTMLRSTPVFFLQDDHDYFENDHADDTIVTFPPDPFMLALARATQKLYYPEFLPDADRPAGLGGSSAADRAPGVSEIFGTLRYGRLVEAMLWDCRRYMTLAGPTGGFMPRETEAWLLRRMAAPTSDVMHQVQIPSTPVGWSAGKWGEWYPDLLEESGKLGTTKKKPYWQEGWNRQHDRLLEAGSKMGRKPLWVSGDLHAIGAGRILRSGSLNLRSNPITTVLAGPLGTGPPGWASVFRGIGPSVPSGIEVEEHLRPIEKNGFTLIDWTPEGATLRMFSWKLGEDPAAIDRLQPFHTLEV
jgi:hypothetical protein